MGYFIWSSAWSSKTSKLPLWNLSTTNLESISKLTFSSCSLWTDCKVFKRPTASLISTVQIGENHYVLASPKCLFSSRIQRPTLTSSILHFNATEQPHLRHLLILVWCIFLLYLLLFGQHVVIARAYHLRVFHMLVPNSIIL